MHEKVKRTQTACERLLFSFAFTGGIVAVVVIVVAADVGVSYLQLLNLFGLVTHTRVVLRFIVLKCVAEVNRRHGKTCHRIKLKHRFQINARCIITLHELLRFPSIFFFSCEFRKTHGKTVITSMASISRSADCANGQSSAKNTFLPHSKYHHQIFGGALKHILSFTIQLWNNLQEAVNGFALQITSLPMNKPSILRAKKWTFTFILRLFPYIVYNANI